MEKSLMIVAETFEIGGVETYIRSQVAQVLAQGWRVHLICGPSFSAAMLPSGLTTVVSDLGLGPGASIEEFLGCVDRMVEIARRHDVSLIHAHPFTSLFPAVAVASSMGIPCIATLHGPNSISGSYGAAYDFMLGSLVLPAASRVFAVSAEVAALARPFVEEDRLSIVLNATAPRSSSSILATPPQGGRWLAVGRLDQAKSGGIIQFARAAMDAGIAGVDICGDGPSRDHVQAALSELIDRGDVRLLGAHPEAAALMPSYAGVAGMGRVALEGLIAGVPVVLVGYDGIKGVLDADLYAAASWANLSGRGLANISNLMLTEQLERIDADGTASLAARIESERDAAVLWADFTAEARHLTPVRSETVETYMQQLRAAHPHSRASAFWSREVMDTLSRVVAAPSLEGSPLVAAYAVHSLANTRAVVEQQASATREMIERQAGEARSALRGLAEAIADGRQQELIARQLREWMLDSEARTAELLDRRLASGGEAMAEQLREIVDRIATHRHEEASRTDQALRGMSAELLKGVREALVAEVDRLNGCYAEAAAQGEATLQSLADIHRALAQQAAAAEAARGDDRLAMNEAITGMEAKMERALQEMESTVRQDLVRISSELDTQAEMGRDIIELHQRVLELEQELVDVYGSTSWALTRPMRAIKRILVQPRATWRHVRSVLSGNPPSDGHAPGSPTASSRLRRAWNLIRRSARTGRLDPADKARLLGMIRSNYTSAIATLGVEVKRPPLAPAEDGLEDVFVWSVIDWHFRMQRPQHLAAALAGKGHRVFYISNNFVDSRDAGFSVEALDTEGRLFQVNLNVPGAPQIYFDVASAEQVAAIQASLASLLGWTATTSSMSLVQHPFWIEPAQSLPNMRLVYDCMDHHGGFENNAESVLAGERTLVTASDLLIVTSQWLYDEMCDKSANIAMIRNATEYEHFCDRPAKVFVDPDGRRIIGYYGAIAEWFDVELIRQVASDHPRDLVVLVGRDTAGAEERLKGLPNVRFVGEVPYAELPYWVHAFDVCLLPFLIIPLTLATNPVKVYEYLSAGKPVVSVDLPEMAQFNGLVSLADEPIEFSRAVTHALEPSASAASAVQARQAFARQQTWAHRAADLDRAMDAIEEPKVSVVVLCFNNLDFTRACLDSLDLYSDYPNLEVIAVDNASTDGTQDFLRQWEAEGANRRFIGNATNLGFSAGNNVGLRAATGEYLVVLNNDTYVTPGWVRGLVRHLRRNPQAGLIGPVTNNIGNEARIEIHYASMEEMIASAGNYTRRHPGHAFPMGVAAFFCVMLTRRAYEAVGPMDEDFGVGFFEDDDYCRRLALCGFEILCADDVFVHHHLSASFNQLKADAKQELFEKNKKIYEAKWGPWVPHVYRERRPS
ncbi:glycosyltransferase [Pseudoxanthomonas sp.]|uniref:glycosyltransferase n=1 Tax=Pseudoxanthomonas sp. TaxID=1871049 RepID=UPI002E14BAAD|nr:glycosyltransferase [Pseudoxanthomonas sp.]